MKMKKQMAIMLLAVAALFLAIFVIKAVKGAMQMKYMMASMSPVITVSAMKVEFSPWQPKLTASGTLSPINGVDVTTEIAGLITATPVIPGSWVKQGDLLVELNTDSDIAQLHALQANAELAQTIYDRDKAQYAIKAVSKAVLDSDAADLKSKQAQVAEQAAIVAKKRIRAPFSGRLGIVTINLGQYLHPGDKIATLEQLDPIYVDFYIPQQALVQLKMGQPIRLTTDAFPGQIFTGAITTIEPKVDPATRNIAIEATLSNPKGLLLPGMFATVEVEVKALQHYLTLPQTAISYNPYGDIVYVITEKGTDGKGKPQQIANQVFVKLGEKRGDQVAILTGLKKGDLVVTSGQLKLKNGSIVAINNSVVPGNNPAPTPVDE